MRATAYDAIMRKKKREDVRALKKKWVYWLLSAALVACVYLVVDRTRERTVGQVCPELKEATACTVVIPTVELATGTRTLEGGELDAFVDYLSKVACRTEGIAAGDTYEGLLYHMYFFANGQETQTIFATTEGYMKIGNKGYSFQPEELCGYLDSLLAA